MHDINQKRLYHILNQTIAQSFSDKGDRIDVDANIFREKYKYISKQNIQLYLFDDVFPTKQEVYDVTSFCNVLERFRESVDIYADNPEDLSIKEYGVIYEGITKFRPFIYPENESILNLLESAAKRHLPEFKHQIMIDEYISTAKRILKAKKRYQRDKNKFSQEYEKDAYNLLQDIDNNRELRGFTSPQKLELYKHCLDMINCLSIKKYSRSKKYQMKCQIYLQINKEASALGEKYNNVARNAQIEYRRFSNALYNIRNYLSDYSMDDFYYR